MPKVLLPSSLRQYFELRPAVEVEGNTVSAVLDKMIVAAPQMRNHLFAADQLRNFVVVAKNGVDIRRLDGLATDVVAGDEIRILSSIAGG